MKGLSNSTVKMIRFIELYLCPQYCGVIDRRRVIAYLFFTLIEAVVIPLHFFLFLMFWEPMGFGLTCAHLIAFSVIQWTIWKQSLSFDNGLSALFMVAAGKLVIDCMFCVIFGVVEDHISVLGNVFVMMVIGITALSLMLRKTALVVALAMIPVLAIYVYTESSVTLWLSLKPLLVGILMFVYVYTYNMSKVTKGLRQPREINQEEKKALEMLANIRDLDHDKAESLLERLTPEMRQRIVGLATERLRKEERELLAWDLVCVELTKSEKVICKLILEGKTLKEICSILNKSESNITSQRCHIRRKLKMGRKDDLRRTLELKIIEVRDAL